MKCGQVTCSAEAVTAFLWPGRAWLPACRYHANVAVNIGGVMGVHVYESEDQLPVLESIAAKLVIAHVKS